MKHDPSAKLRDLIPKRTDEQAAFALLSELEQNHSILSASIGGGINAFGNLFGQGNSSLISEITQLHEDFHADKMSRNQYNYRRQKIVKDLANRMGPVFRRNQLRIDRRKGVVPTHKIQRHAKRIAKLSKLASRSGVVLAGVGATLSCRDIANTDDRQEKNEIFVETIVGSTAGFAAGYAVTVLLLSNPVGWGVAIVFGVGTAAVGFASGKAARSVYSVFGDEIDFVSGLGVDKVCK